MLIAHLADLHLTDRPPPGTAGLGEQVDNLRGIAREIHDSGPAIVVVAGDVFDGLSTPASRNAAIEVFRELAHAGPVFVVYGNHDRPGDLDFLASLETLQEITVYSRPGCAQIGGVYLAALPWPRKAHFAGALPNLTAEQLDNAAAEAMRAVMRGFTKIVRSGEPGPLVVVGHIELGGASLESGQPLAGKCDIELCEGDLLDVGADYYALGHVHKHQTFANSKIVYPGSPRPCRFGDETPKGYVLVDVEPGGPTSLEFCLAQYRELRTLDAQFVAGTEPAPISEGFPEGPIVSLGFTLDRDLNSVSRGTSVRLKYTAPEQHRQQAAELAETVAAELRDRDCLVKIVPEILPTDRVRCEAVRDARTPAEKLEAYWTAREIDHNDAWRISIHAKLRELEGQP